MIEIISPTRIEVDGKDAGLPVEYILANPTKKAEINAAFIAWHASHVVAVQNKDASVTALRAQALEAVAQAVAAKEEIRRIADEEIAAIRADMAILGTKPEAAEMRKAQQAKALRDRIAADRAELEKLTPLETTDLEPIDVDDFMTKDGK